MSWGNKPQIMDKNWYRICFIIIRKTAFENIIIKVASAIKAKIYLLSANEILCIGE